MAISTPAKLIVVACLMAGAAIYVGAMPLPDTLAKLLPVRAPFQQAQAPAQQAQPTGQQTSGSRTAGPPASAAPGQAPGAGPRGGAGGRPPVSVLVANSERKPMPVRLDAIGTVQTIASVTLRSRVDSQIMEVAFEDGAKVNKGDVLFRLDARQIEALIAQAEANIARDKASLQSADADLRRTEALAKRDFATDKVLDASRATVGVLQATIKAGEAQLENLRVQRSYYTIIAPISGRIGFAGLKAGNIARAGDGSPVLGILNQTAPIYVAFAMPQRHLPEIKAAVASGSAHVLATPQGYNEGFDGKLAIVDNSVDATTGTIALRAIFDNKSELLWPGALCQVRLTLRTEPNALVVAREAVQSGQNGSFVFEIVEGVAKARNVKVDRIVDGFAVIASGLNGGEIIVIDGQQQLADGSRVNIRQPGGRTAPAADAPPQGERRNQGSAG
jgi:membrane fusion protein, multidrug efflux system